MADPQVFKFSFQELAALMVKHQGIKEGVWGIYVRFGLSAANVGVSESTLVPAVIAPLLEVGLQKFEAPNSLTVDAAEVWKK